MDKKQVAAVLDEMGTLLELKGENPFRTRAYHNAALALTALSADLDELVNAGTLTDVKGIGKGLAAIIAELVRTGSSKDHQELRSSLPHGLLDMLRIQGLGPKRIRILYERLNLTTIDQLQKACESHQLSAIDGFGAKTEENILTGIRQLAAVASKFLYSDASEFAGKMLAAVSSATAVKYSEIAGSLRRRKELIGDIDILAAVPAAKRAPVFEAFVTHPLVTRVEVRGETKASVRLTNGIQCDLRLVEESEFPFTLNYSTGSKEHNVEMRSRALARGWSLNEYGFTRSGAKNSKRLPACVREEDLYEALGLQYIPPELRENLGEFEAAEAGTIPELVTEQDLRGTFHCHTTESDGLNTLEEMAAAAKALGWEYLGIADHSQAAAYAGGLTPDRVKAQWKAIDRLNARTKGFRIFKGTECDILADGSLDFSDRLLAGFEYVVASIHSKFKMSESEATKRIIRALKHRHVTMLGHPTGRLLLEREGYPVNMTEVITAAADYGKAIEINAHPMRLDLDWRLVRFAKEKGVTICINPDAHNTGGLKDTMYGIGIARKGWLGKKDVLNAQGVAAVERFFQRVTHGEGRHKP